MRVTGDFRGDRTLYFPCLQFVQLKDIRLRCRRGRWLCMIGMGGGLGGRPQMNATAIAVSVVGGVESAECRVETGRSYEALPRGRCRWSCIVRVHKGTPNLRGANYSTPYFVLLYAGIAGPYPTLPTTLTETWGLVRQTTTESGLALVRGEQPLPASSHKRDADP